MEFDSQSIVRHEMHKHGSNILCAETCEIESTSPAQEQVLKVMIIKRSTLRHFLLI